MATITIGGVKVTGDNIEIRNGKVIVDGVEFDGVMNTAGVSITNGGTLEVRVLEGRLGNLRADGSIHCENVEGSVNAGGSVHANNVTGNANAGGSVTCGDVGGNASAGGSVKCGDVRGNVTAMTVKRG